MEGKTTQSGLIESLLRTVVLKGASDLHLQAGSPPIFRVHGELTFSDMEPMTDTDMENFVNSVLTEDQKKKFEKNQHVDFAYALDEMSRFRINVFNQRRGLGAAIRLIPVQIPTMEELRLPLVLKDLASRPNGLILLTGPTGQGKSTTLAAVIGYINSIRKGHIITIEDPIEFVHANKLCVVNQREVGRHTESFASALRSALREDPDVILVGEMRDLETISNAITAAETGHLVFGTLHTNDVVQAIDRMIDVFPPHQQPQIRSQLAACLQAVVHQVLLKKKDGTGRVGAFEVMICNVPIRNLIRESKTAQIYNILQTSRQENMQLMHDSLRELYKEGIITAQEALSKVSNPQEFEKELLKTHYSSFHLAPNKLPDQK